MGETRPEGSLPPSLRRLLLSSAAVMIVGGLFLVITGRSVPIGMVIALVGLADVVLALFLFRDR